MAVTDIKCFMGNEMQVALALKTSAHEFNVKNLEA